MKDGSITIKDIARELNISFSTVSRALADNPVVKPSTRNAVKELAEKYNYTPSYRALSLRYKKTHTIGIIVPNLVHEFFSKVIRGIEDFAMKKDYNVILSPTHDSFSREVSQVNALINGRVDGLIACITNETNDFQHFQESIDRNIPLVFFDSVSDDFEVPNVVLNDEKAAYDAVVHLAEQGCQKIGYVGGPNCTSVNKARFRGYCNALEHKGITIRDELIVHCPSDDTETGINYSKELVNQQQVDGIFATTDLLSIGVIKSIKSFGKNVPNDIAVVGFSNWSICSIYEPSVSSMSQPGYEIGIKAAELLLQQIENPEKECNDKITIDSELMIRESSQRK